MAIEKHVVELAARDTLSPALKNISKNATDAGRSAEQAAKKASTATADWGRAAQNMGRVLGAVGAAAILLGNESEVAQTRLEQSISNTGDSYELLEEQINAATDAALELGFDDEDAINALTSLTDATGDAETAMKDLGIAQDIARGRGISLAAATNIVIAAEQGRYGALKRMGIAIDENATKEEALAALHGKYAGQAEAYATTNAAAWDRMGNAIENKLEIVGGALADMQGPLIALGGASQLIGPLGDAFTALGGKAKLASMASTVLASSWMGPAGLAVGAGLAGFAIYSLITGQTEAEKQARALTAATDDYTASIVANTTALVNANAYDQTKQTQELLGVWIDDGLLAQKRIDEVSAAVVDLSTNLGDQAYSWSAVSAMMEGLDDDQKRYIEDLLRANGALEDGIVTADELSAILPQLSSGFELTSDQATALTQAMHGIEEAAANPQLFGQQLAEDAAKILQQVHDGTISVVDGIEQLNALPGAEKYNKALQESIKLQTAAQVSAGDLYNTLYGGVAAIENNGEALGIVVDQTERASDATLEYVDILGRSDKMLDKNATSARESVAASRQLTSEIDALAESLKMVGATGLDQYMGMIVGFTDGIVDSVSAAKDWADALIAPIGTYSELDNMLAAGIITLSEYNAAQKAQVDITDAYNISAAARNEIQAMQAPLIAEQALAAAEYADTLSNLTAEEQTLALAWADSDLSGRAMEIANMSSEFDDMNSAQQDAFTNMVTSAAATDPALAAVLEDMGLIKASATDPTGWTIVMDSSDAESDMDRLTSSINNLASILAQAYNINVTTSFDTSGFWAAYNALPDYHAINVYTTGGTYGPTEHLALGGTAKDYDTAALGRAGRGLTLVGEHGPEMVTLPHGSMVTPNHATRYAGNDARGGDTIINIHQVVAQDFNTFVRQMREYEKGMNRR